MTENFTKLMSDTKTQIQEAHRTPSKIIVRKTTPRHIIFKYRNERKQNPARNQRGEKKKTFTHRDKDKP